MDTPLTHATVRTNGVNLHVVQAGAEDAPLVILLHGFPEFWYGWRHQIPYLVEQGYRVWVPDQRGYNLSDKPAGIADYTLDKTSADVVGLIEAAGVEKAFVVGHDWGAAVTWRFAQQYPQYAHKIVTMNVPHNSVFRRYISTHPSQLMRSWYMFFIQLPFLPQWSISSFNWIGLSESVRNSGFPDTFTNEDMKTYREAWAKTGDGTSMINWYRAAMQVAVEKLPSPRITVPTLLIWGKKDIALEQEMAQLSIELCDDGRLVYIDNATHWVQHDASAQVNDLLGDFLK